MNYIMRYKGKYRLLCELDQNIMDFNRNEDGTYNDIDVYISCQYGNRIYTYGHIDNKKPVWLIAYIPSLQRGHNVIKVLQEKGVEYIDVVETDSEVEFKFLAKDIEAVADLLKAKTSGASISPFSSKNLGKRKDIILPDECVNKYKNATSIVDKKDILIINKITTDFLSKVLQKELRRSDKKFDYVSDMKKMNLARQRKEYIYSKGMFDEYINYLKKEIENFYK